MALRTLTALLSLCLYAGAGLAQQRPGENMAGTQEAVAYRQGVGRILWTFPSDLVAAFAAPNWTAGARVKCGNKEFECEVQVFGRDISVSDAERRQQLEEALAPLLVNALDKQVAFRTHGADAGIVYATLQFARPAEDYHYMTLGYAHRGPALLKFQVLSTGAPRLDPLLRLVQEAKAIDALAMWALRLGDYRATCAERFPAYKDANERVYAASPFGAVDVVQAFLKLDPSQTEQAVRDGLAQARRGFAQEFDSDTPERRQAFCEGFPRWVAEAARGL
ncbi:MAG: hypothetical protein WAO95_04305 [Burkholderiales bacterium]